MWILGLRGLLTNEKGTGAVHLLTRLMSGEWLPFLFHWRMTTDYRN